MKQRSLKKIIIAEDDPDILEILKMITEKAGYKVETTTDGKSLLKKRDYWPNLIIMDRRLPGIDGLDICRYLRTCQATKLIPIIMISATPDLASRAQNAGANDFLEKPFNITDLLAMITKHIN